jgi:tetratricopeptide (TPR) repeat protein
MKPRAFIGSSVEGLGIAYAVQQNLLHDAEITVWSQGVFELSATAVESLTTVLSSSDFGIFIFTPDDFATIRQQGHSIVRDNVLFELGLFIGKLGKERTFFVQPDSTKDLHIPTDLFGLTPAKYESARTDGNWEAATGAACHQIRTQMKKLGLQPNRLSLPSSPIEAIQNEVQTEQHWLDVFFEGKYDDAKNRLLEKAKTETGNDLLSTQAWLIYCDVKLDVKNAFEKLYAFGLANASSINDVDVINLIAMMLTQEKYTDKAIALINASSSDIQNDPIIRLRLSDCHIQNEDKTLALEVLESADFILIPRIAIKKSELLEAEGDIDAAIQAIHQSYLAHPSNEEIRYRYARIASEVKKYEIAAYFLFDLTKDFPMNSSYWGYLGNACFSLGLADQALVAYRKGLETQTSATAGVWIQSNIGNLLTNRDLPSEGYLYLNESIKLKPSEYAYERLSISMKQRDTEVETFTKKRAEGLKQVRAMLSN